MNSKKVVKKLNSWNRKLHIHIGLLLLLFIWLFSFSGLLLNHSEWKFFSFWDERKELKTVTAITLPTNRDSLAILQQVMRQVNITGEVSEVKMTPDSVDFRVEAPGTIHNLHVNLKKAICTQTRIDFNWWGKIRTLHTFNGVNQEKPKWWITQVWRLAMDGIAMGLIFLCLSSWWMWYKIRQDYTWGPMILGLGFVGAIYFVFLLGML